MAEIKILCKMGRFIQILKCIRAKIAQTMGRYTNLEQISIQNTILIERDLSMLNSIPHVKRHWIQSVV